MLLQRWVILSPSKRLPAEVLTVLVDAFLRPLRGIAGSVHGKLPCKAYADIWTRATQPTRTVQRTI
jgi:hypothetical protein